ncbi:MAG: T9SS type A sorting domain-containing protein [Flavobacteriales bacterium]
MKHALLLLASTLAITSDAQWVNIGSGISNTPRKIFSISAVDENTVWAVAWDPSGAACYDFTMTTDGGGVWNAGELPNVGAYYPGQIHAQDAQTAWALLLNTPEQDRVKIMKTSDGGANWVDQPGEFNNAGLAFASLHFFNANDGLGFGSPGTGNPTVDSLRIYRTSNGGNTWLRVPAASLPAPAAAEGQWVFGDNRCEARGDTLWFCTRAGRVWRTTDKGISWQAFTTGLLGSNNYPGLASVAFENHLRGIATSYAPSQAVRTEDGGETWTPITIPSSPLAGDIEYVPGTAGTYFVNKGYLNASNTSSPYLITHDSGETWVSVNYSPALPVVEFLSPTVAFAGGNITSPAVGGIYEWNGVVGINDGDDSADRISAFPNPSSGNIMLQLPHYMRAQRINVIDASGRTVLVRSAVHTVAPFALDLHSLHDGLYLLQVEFSDGTVLTERIAKN